MAVLIWLTGSWFQEQHSRCSTEHSGLHSSSEDLEPNLERVVPVELGEEYVAVPLD